MYKVDCNNRALWAENLDCWLAAGKLIWASCPHECKRPKNQGQQRSHWPWWEESRSWVEFPSDSLLGRGKA